MDQQQNMPHLTKDDETSSVENNRNLARSMSLIYGWMALGLMTSAIVAIYVWQNPPIQVAVLFNSAVFYTLLGLQLLMVFVFSMSYKKVDFKLALVMYLTYSILVGMTLSIIFVVYQLNSIFSVFISSSFAFMGLSLFGLTTHRDLNRLGTFALTGLFGLVALMFMGILVPSVMSNALSIALNISGVIIFSILAAFDTQTIRKDLAAREITPAESINHALKLYLDFINLFLNLLRLLGKKK